MTALLMALVDIGRWFVQRFSTVTGALAIVTAFGGIGSSLIVLRAFVYDFASQHLPDKFICYLSVFGFFNGLDIFFGMIGSALAIRLTRILAKQYSQAVASRG